MTFRVSTEPEFAPWYLSDHREGQMGAGDSRINWLRADNAHPTQTWTGVIMARMGSDWNDRQAVYVLYRRRGIASAP